MAVRHCGLLARPARRPLEPGRLRAGGLRDRLVAVLVQLDVVEMHDIRRTFARRSEVDVAELRLDVPGVVGAALGPEVAEALRARARQPAVLDWMSSAEDEQVETVGSGAEGVLEVIGDLHDRVARANLEDLFVL